MIVDVIFAILVVLAFYNGYKKGLIYSVLSFIAIFLGILLAMNFSSMAATWLSQSFNIPPVVLPVLSFILVVVIVIAAIKLVAIIVEKVLKAIMLNFFNRLAGGLLWGVIATLLFSTGIWLIDRTGIFTENVKETSMAFQFVLPLGPIVFDFVGNLIPILKDSFFHLNETIQEATKNNQ